METQSLKQAIAPFLASQGAYPRLIKIANNSVLKKAERIEAAYMLMEKAMGQQNLEQVHNLSHFKRIYERARKIVEEQLYPAGTDRPVYPVQLRDHIAWATQTRAEYEGMLRQKNMEIQNLQKNQLKDSIRIALQEMGGIYHKFGYEFSALSFWEKSYDVSSSPEDQVKMSLQIMQAAYVSSNQYALTKYCERARMQDSGKNVQSTQFIEIMSALCHFQNDRALEGAKILVNQSNLSLVIDGNADLEQFVSGKHLAYYLVLSCLAHMSRLELKNEVMSKSHVLSLLENYEDLSNTFDNFLNGRFEELQMQINKIQEELKYDLFFGTQSIYRMIRNKNLQQYVAPYKVIDMREIATAFGISLQMVEEDLAEQIQNGSIKAKIDSNKKLLYSRQVNTQQETYKKAVQVGDKFIRDTEEMLLKINLIRNNLVLQSSMSREV